MTVENRSNGQWSFLYRWNTAGSGSWSQYSWFAYDALQRVSSFGHAFAGSGNDRSASFTYNPAGQIASTTAYGDSYAWTGATPVNRSYTANGLNQYSQVGGTSFGYDSNGNLTSDGTQSYVYDVENRLVSRSGGGTSATLRYDPLGRLYEVNGSATGMTRFLYDGDALVAEYNSSGTMLRRYVHGVGTDTPLVQFEGSGVSDAARRYLYADERGSIIAVTDSTGNVLNKIGYDEYGLFSESNSSYRSRFQYTGQAYIPELGLYYYKARMYSPTLGRFMQTDPIGYGDGMNMYAYVKNDPVNGKDPSGLEGETKEEFPPIVIQPMADCRPRRILGMDYCGPSNLGELGILLEMNFPDITIWAGKTGLSNDSNRKEALQNNPKPTPTRSVLGCLSAFGENLFKNAIDPFSTVEGLVSLGSGLAGGVLDASIGSGAPAGGTVAIGGKVMKLAQVGVGKSAVRVAGTALRGFAIGYAAVATGVAIYQASQDERCK